MAATAGMLCGGWAAGKVPCGYDVEIVAQDCGIFGEDTEGLGLAPNGLVVGAFSDCQDGKPFYHAFLWPPGGSMQVVPLSTGGPTVYSMELFDANDAGQSVGTLKEEDGYWAEAFMLDNGKVIPLGVLPGAIASEALAVNSHGVVVGWSGFSARVSHNAVLWQQDGRIIDLARDLGNPPLSEATDLTGSGLVTGWMGTDPTLDAQAFIWNSANVLMLPLLPEPGVISTVGNAINANSNICGAGFVPHPTFGYCERAYASLDGRAIALGALPGYAESRANDISIDNQIVGICYGGGPTVGFVWGEGVMHALTDLIDPELDLHITEANAISDSGIITGRASGGYAVRLIPRISADLDCDGTIGGIDLAALLAQWGECTRKLLCPGDLNVDGLVNGFDLAMLLASWG